MPKRQPISKAVRFEVFKRDSFTCQYCGAAAPDVILHVDHINPVAGGGTSGIMNLVTSCEPCNLGKGAKPLDDRTAIAKQREQLVALNERREQLEMMLAWREGLAGLDDEYVDALNEVFQERTNCHLNEYGRGKAKSYIKKHGLQECLDALDAALDSYYRDGDPDDGERNNQLAGKAFSMVPRIIGAKKRYADRPWMKELFYIRAIIRNRLYCNERVCIDILERAYNAGADPQAMIEWAKQARNWTNWRNEMEEWIEELEAPESPE